jgi:hypothetical protein
MVTEKKMSSKLPRGIRNNNPLNIEKNAKNKWQGKVAKSTDRRFEQFVNPVMGLRAGAVLIINHFDRKKANTIRKMVGIWAPPKENNTNAYILNVANRAKVDSDEEVNFHDYAILRPVLQAMVFHENGTDPYTDAQYDKALAMAGVVPNKSLNKSGTIKATTAGTTATIGAAAIDGFQDTLNTAAGQLQELAPMLDYAKWGLLAITLISLAYVAYRRWDDHRRLVR